MLTRVSTGKTVTYHKKLLQGSKMLLQDKYIVYLTSIEVSMFVYCFLKYFFVFGHEFSQKLNTQRPLC